jgi:CheY-like chemotaxis protein
MDEMCPKIRRLHPLRVLLAARDRRFIRVTSFLLERRGYDVIQESGRAIAEAVTRCRADVVLLEADMSRASTARTLTALEALPTPPGVIAIYSDEGVEHLPGVTSLSKWAPIEELQQRIDAAALERDITAAHRHRSQSSH